MKDITDRFEITNGQYVSSNTFPAKATVTISSDYCWIKVPKQKGISVDVAKKTASSSWPRGIVKFADENDILNDGIGLTAEIGYSSYTRLDLKFPEWAEYAYVNSAITMPPKVYKKVM